ncbi:hypothetical protein NVP2275O_228 [Vibrio phage 2.275.O._10N.286.54.E11]|nr:hypothetical protein NVP2275O_228 [Vibrio phage 2.275.O._10N.286.54.E11]
MKTFVEGDDTIVYASSEYFIEELEIYALRLQISYDIQYCNSGWTIKMSHEDFKQFKLRFDL